MVLPPRRWLNRNGNGNDDLVWFDLVRQRKLRATQRTFIDVTLDMNLVSTTPHANDRSYERFETHGTLFDFPVNSQVDLAHFIRYFVNKTLKPMHYPTLVEA
jgi:hypothetical protein